MQRFVDIVEYVPKGGVMKKWMTAMLAVAAAGMASEGHDDRASLAFSLGGGVITPWLFSDDTQAQTGFGGMLGVETPMTQGHQFALKAGFFTAGSDREAYSSVGFVPLTLSYRMYPFYRRWAGPRGIEPMIGVHAGGVLAWDSAEGNADRSTTGGGIIGAELGARVPVGWSNYIELSAALDYMPLGASLAGEEKDCGALRIMASVVF